jgi:hypothetical protein
MMNQATRQSSEGSESWVWCGECGRVYKPSEARTVTDKSGQSVVVCAYEDCAAPIERFGESYDKLQRTLHREWPAAPHRGTRYWPAV